MSEVSSVSVRVRGELACWTRPEFHSERVSYPVMTPSGARGILESICWKPEMRWIVRRIVVECPIAWAPIKRNEIQDKVSTRNATLWMKEPSSFRPYLANVTESREMGDPGNRTQRNTLALRDVSYVIEAVPWVHQDARANHLPVKYIDMFNRRVSKGQCFQQPYLGCREFVAEFETADGPSPIDQSANLGLMLYDIEYERSADGPQPVGALFFEARLDRGVLVVPDEHGPDVRRLEPKEVGT